MKKKLIIAFLSLITIKISLALFIKGIILFPDESCFFLKGEYFIKNFNINSCQNLLNFETGNPFPAYSILISPIFLFLKTINAFHAIQILNIVLISSLVLPLSKIFQTIIKKENYSIFISSILLLLPIVSSYEKMILSENLFLFSSIWLTYFYQKSFKTQKYIIPTILGALIATLTRPFGFIIILAILINELLQKQKRKLIIFFLISLILISTAILHKNLPHIYSNLQFKIESLKHIYSYLYIVKALKNEFITLLFSTLFIPCLIFFTYFPKDKTKQIKNIKGFIISFIILNFIVSAQHIYEYFLKGHELDFLTRYINLSIIFIIGFGLIYIQKIKNLKINTLIFLIFIIPLFFINLDFSNHALNISISPYFKEFRGFLDKELFFKKIFPIIAFILIILTIKNKKKILHNSLITIILLQFITINIWQIKYTNQDYSSPIFQNLKTKNETILLLESSKKQELSKTNYINFDYFRLKTLSENKIKVVAFNDLVNNKPEINSNEFKNKIQNFSYLITPYQLDLEKINQDQKGYFLYNLNIK